MDSDVDLLTPVEGLAGLICRGFTMRQIASLYALRARFLRRPGARRQRPIVAPSPPLSRCGRARTERRRWRKF
jgi:hypothetical protein